MKRFLRWWKCLGKKQFACLWCGDKFYSFDSKAGLGHSFCSMDCQDKAFGWTQPRIDEVMKGLKSLGVTN